MRELQTILKKTVIIYPSDQAMMLGEHDFIDKRLMNEEFIQLPFIIRYLLKKIRKRCTTNIPTPEYQEIIAELKQLLKQKRKEISNTDDKFPRIKKIVQFNWE